MMLGFSSLSVPHCSQRKVLDMLGNACWCVWLTTPHGDSGSLSGGGDRWGAPTSGGERRSASVGVRGSGSVCGQRIAVGVGGPRTRPLPGGRN